MIRIVLPINSPPRDIAPTTKRVFPAQPLSPRDSVGPVPVPNESPAVEHDPASRVASADPEFETLVESRLQAAREPKIPPEGGTPTRSRATELATLKAFSFSVQIRLNLWLKLFNSLGTGIFPDSSDLWHKCYRAERVMANSAHARWHVLRRNRFWRHNRWHRRRTSKLACRRSSQARDACRILFLRRCIDAEIERATRLQASLGPQAEKVGSRRAEILGEIGEN